MIKKNIFSIIVALTILYLSLASSKSFNEVPFLNIPYFDKIVHFVMYFGLMSVIAFEHRNEITGRTQLSMFALIPFVYGILMEILQFTITADRSGNIYDVSCHTLPELLFPCSLWLLIEPWLKKFSNSDKNHYLSASFTRSYIVLFVKSAISSPLVFS